MADVSVIIERIDDFPRYNVILKRLNTAPFTGVILGYKGLPEIIRRTSEVVLPVLRRSDRPVVLRFSKGGEAGVSEDDVN